jgi:S1-C subfamily serine protease
MWHGLRPFLRLRPRPVSTCSLREPIVSRLGRHSGGDRLLDVDDQPVQSFRDIQAAIRKNKIGDAMRLRIARGMAAPREVLVRHVSDYP